MARTTARIPTIAEVTPDPLPARRGGRPSRADAALLADRILDAAIAGFLGDGFAATSMEAIAQAAGVSKRTLYAHYPDKNAVLRAALARMIGAWLVDFDAALAGRQLEAALTEAARSMLDVALAPAALALYRLLVAEGARIPELPVLLAEAGAGEGIVRIASLLTQAGVPDPVFAAEQFQRLVITGPQHRALGFGPPMTEVERAAWPARCVGLFLHGARA